MKKFLQLLALIGLIQPANGDIILTLTQSGSGVIADWSGFGTLVGSPGGILNFNNFNGNPFTADAAFSLSDNLVLTGNTTSAGTYFNLYDQLEFTVGGGGGVGTSDLTFRRVSTDPPSLTNLASGFTYDALSPFPEPAVVVGLDFSLLNVGTYAASTTVTDAADFGGFTLNIVAESTSVPEPSMSSVIMICLCILVAKRIRAPHLICQLPTSARCDDSRLSV